ncbi:lantibiotic ABC transporter permease, partial [Bifidobacteriaceae bacterium NR015]
MLLTVLLLIAICIQNLALAKIGVTDLPQGTFNVSTLISFAAYSFITSMPVLSFMIFVSSRFENMWVTLGIGVAGFLSGMALASSDIVLFIASPFIVMLKPAVAMSAQPNTTVVIVSIVETILFLCSGLWAAKNLHYE